ncbi:MAG: hypothetical protein HQL19_00905 [Candidatus Omnitrophica bacterium]|nr:hypothetical protein [Candidatus Omnitrophota bacterium]
MFLDLFQRIKARHRKDVVRARDIVSDVIEDLQQSVPSTQGMPTGAYDRGAFDVRRGQLALVLGCPWVGVTAFLSSIALHVTARRDMPCAYYSFDMPAKLLLRRMLCQLSGVSLAEPHVRTAKADELLPRLTAAAGVLSEAPIYIADGCFDIIRLEDSIKACVREKRIQLVVIDGLDEIGLLYAADIEVIRAGRERFCARLKALAVSLDIAIIVSLKMSDALQKELPRPYVEPKLHKIAALEGDLARVSDNISVLDMEMDIDPVLELPKVYPRRRLWHIKRKFPGDTYSDLDFDDKSLRCSFRSEDAS